MINFVKQIATSACHDVSLEVVQSGMDIIVRAGNFRISGIDYTIDDQEFTVVPDAVDDVLVTGFLARDNKTGGVVVFVDEEILGGKDFPFSFKGSQYSPLFLLYRVRVRAGAADLYKEDVVVHCIVEQNGYPEASNAS